MAPTITISGLTTNGAITDGQTIQPFGSVTVTDSFSGDLVSATISFAVANGTLAGAGLSGGAINAGTVTYALSAATPSALQAELHGLIFMPTVLEAAAGTQVTTAFDLTVTDVTTWSPVATPTLVAMLSSGVANPDGVATDAAGDVFVANGNNNANVEEFSASGALLRTLSGGSSGQAYAVATDAAGDVFVANGVTNTVDEFNASGALLRTLSSGVNAPFGVATDAAGNVFVANWGNNTVDEFSASGALLRTLSSGVDGPEKVATDAVGDVFVANFKNNTVDEFGASGALLRTLSSGVDGPTSVATDAAGDVFVANYENSTVEEFNASAALLRTLSSGVDSPEGVATDAAGDVFVASFGNNTVEEFNASGALVGTLSDGVSGPASVSTDAAGNVFVANEENSTVEEFKVSQLTSVSDASTQVAVTQTICFMAGTMIRTPDGDTPIEGLQRGDLVVTAAGETKPVAWLGRQTVSSRFADPVRSWPVRIKAGALQENSPARDLLVSPDHALLVEDVLIQAGALVNGTSIARETAVPSMFVYYHIELDDHSLILAENAPAETFVDNVDRLGFDNWAEHEALYPNGKPVDEMQHPRAKARRQVPIHIRAKVDARAKALCTEVRLAVA
jgi:sugar lactone lactonase YvrE